MENETTLPHPFEQRGLGKAPFVFTGVSENRFEIPGVGYKPGGTCDYCGNGILYEFHCKSADGKKFHVGCDCVAKLDRDSNRAYKSDATIVAIIRAANELKNSKRHEREAAKIEAGKALIAQHSDALAAIPHPNERRAANGETALDSFNWYMANAGNKGKLNAIKWAANLIGLSS